MIYTGRSGSPRNGCSRFSGQATGHGRWLRQKAKAKIYIDKLTEEELIDLNHRIVERLKLLEPYHTHKEMMGSSSGDPVSFEPPDQKKISGTLEKFRKKTAIIIRKQGKNGMCHLACTH
jgi:hypothetical protein